MNNIKVGIARTVITPPVGSRLCGYDFRTAPSTGVLDDLYARAIIFDNGQCRQALVVCDLLWVPQDLVRRSRVRIQEVCGLNDSEVMITGIHTHSGPDLDFCPSSTSDDLVEKICGTVFAALQRLTEARIGWAHGSCLAGVSRRLPNAPRAPYNLYTDPHGVFDPTVAVMKIDDLSGKPLGVLFNYACHPVCLGWEDLRISKDFLNFTHDVLEQSEGNDFVSIFLQGCSGNVNPRWQWDRPDLSPVPEPAWPKEASARVAETRRIGQMLGGEVLKTLASITQFATTLELGASSSNVMLPVRTDMPEPMKGVLAAHTTGFAKRPGQQDDAFHQAAAGKKEFNTEVQVFRIGDCVLVGLPGEVFVDFQMQLRKKIQAPLVLVSGLANDPIYYVPTAYAYPQVGYEVHVSMLSPQGGQLLADSAVAQSEKLLHR